MSDKDEALRLAYISQYLEGGERGKWNIDVVAELRRQHAEIEALKAECDALRTKSHASRACVVATQGENERLRAERDALRADVDEDLSSRRMFVARLENMQRNQWLTVADVLALLNDCDMLAAIERDAAKEAGK